MAERFASGADIAQVSGTITGGATLVLTESAEAWQALAVFNGLALDEIAELVNNPESAILDQLKIDDKKAESFLQKPPEADDFRLALWVASKIWEAQLDATKTALHLAITIEPQAPLGSMIEILGNRPALVFYPGSLAVSFTPRVVGPWVRFLLTLSKLFRAAYPALQIGYGLKAATWTIAFLLAPNQKPDQALADLLRDAREDEFRLKRLDDINKNELQGKRLILLLHGLFSTDKGTFYNFISAWKSYEKSVIELAEMAKAADMSVPDMSATDILGWPHNTLASIDENADELCKLIKEKIGTDGPSIVFVCHSRGGLLARRTALNLCQTDSRYKDKISACITFGTPHLGAGILNVVPDEWAGQLYTLAALACVAGTRQKSLSALSQVLRYRWGGGDFQGVEDLRPACKRGFFGLRKQNFLDRLQGDEIRAAHPLAIWAVAGMHKPLDQSGCGRFLSKMEHSLKEEDHDWVVETASSHPSSFDGPSEALSCDHFSYFDTQTTTQDQFKKSLAFLMKKLDGSAPTISSRSAMKIWKDRLFLYIDDVKLRIGRQRQNTGQDS